MSQLMKAQRPPEWWLPSKMARAQSQCSTKCTLSPPRLAAQIVIEDVSREHEVSLIYRLRYRLTQLMQAANAAFKKIC